MSTTTEVVQAITAHHTELQEQLTDRVAEVLAAARAGTPHQPALARLHTLLGTDVVPHARAEEDVLYAAATDPTLRPLVAGMIFEHETLLALTAELGVAGTAVDAAGVARAIQEIFVGHVRRENDLLLPALAAAGHPSLVELLPVMQKRFATYREAAR